MHWLFCYRLCFYHVFLCLAVATNGHQFIGTIHHGNVLDRDGKKAYRRKITIGRQNPQYYEVIEGLEPGEQVIVSGYEAYKDNEILMLN